MNNNNNVELINDLNKVADFLESLPEQKQEKKAGLFAIGDTIICLNPIEGIVKGDKYRITSIPRINYLAIEDLYGNEIGLFRQDRFCLDNNEE